MVCLLHLQVIGAQSHPQFNVICCLCDFQYLGGELFVRAKNCVFCFCHVYSVIK